jgi:flavorubredoxin
MEFGIIAVGHGPLLRYNVEELVHRYETWSKQAQEKQLTSVAVLYVSDYGYSDRLSQVRIAERSQHHLIWIRCHDWN